MAPKTVHSVRLFNLEPRSAHCLAYSSSRGLLAVSRSDNSIEIWSFAGSSSAPVLQQWLIPGRIGENEALMGSSVEGLVWAGRNRDRLFSTGLHGRIIEHDLNGEMKIDKPAVTTPGPAWCIDYNLEKNLIAVGTEEGSVCLFEVGEDGLLYDKVLDKQEGRILCLAWHYSGDQLVTGSADTIRVWDTITGHPIHRMSTGRAERNRETTVWSVAFMRDRTIMSGDSRGKTSFWNGETGTLIDSYQTHKADVLTIHVNADETTAYSTGVDPVIMHFQPIEPRAIKKDRGRRKWVKSIHRWVNSHDNRSILSVKGDTVTVGVDGMLIVNENKFIRKYPPIPYGNVVRLASEARCMLFRYPRMIELWRLGRSDMEPVKLLQILSKDDEIVRCCDVSNDSSLIGYSTESRLCLYRIRFQPDNHKPQELKRISTKRKSLPTIHHMKFHRLSSKDDYLLLITERSDLLWIRITSDDDFEIDSEMKRKELKLTSRVSNMALSGNVVVLADLNNNVVAVDLHKSRLLCTFPIYKDAPVTSVAIKDDVVVIVHANGRIFECCLTTGTFTKFSQRYSSYQENRGNGGIDKRNAIRGTSIHDNKIVTYDTKNIYVIDKTEVNENGTDPKRSCHGMTENDNKKTRNFPIKLINKYEHLLFFEDLNEEEMVAVEVKQHVLEEKLPPSLKQRKFGAM